MRFVPARGFRDDPIRFDAGDFKWRCTLSDYACKKAGPAAGRRPGAGASPFAIPPPPSKAKK